MPGKFIVMEGIDGSGKSSQVEFLINWLKQNNIKYYLTDEPSTKGLRDMIKKLVSDKTKLDDASLDALLFTADRRFHILTEILPELENNEFVICDRYYHSTYTYQQTQGMDLNWLISINKYAIKPDLTLIFDVPAEVAVKRIEKSGRDVIDKFEKAEFLEKLRKNYLKLPEQLDEKIIIIDSNRTKEEIFEDVKKIISAL